MERDQFNKHLEELGYTTEDIEGFPFKIGDTVRILRSKETIFPGTLLVGLTGTVVAFDNIANDMIKSVTNMVMFPPWIIVLLPINNLGVYDKEELRKVKSSSRPYYVGFNERFWGLVVQSLRQWSCRLELDLLTHKLRDTGLCDHLIHLAKMIEWQITERNVKDGRPVAIQVPPSEGEIVQAVPSEGDRFWSRFG